MECSFHPGVETNLRCGKCGKPICPRCMVETPVGARCPDCAGVRQLPTYRFSARYYLIAAGAALGMALAGGIAWGVIEWAVPFFSLNLLLAPAVGYAISEVTSLAVNRKRGTSLAIIGAIALIISYLVAIWFTGFLSHISFYDALPLTAVRAIYHIIALGLGIFVAVIRLR